MSSLFVYERMANPTSSEHQMLQELHTQMRALQEKMNAVVQARGTPTMDDVKQFKKLNTEFKAKHLLYATLILTCLQRDVMV